MSEKLGPAELKEEMNKFDPSSFMLGYVEECHELVKDGTLDDYPLVYKELERRASDGTLEQYFDRMAGDFASSLYEGDFEDAFVRADMKNGTVLASRFPDEVIDVLVDMFGEDSLERNLTHRVHDSVAEDILRD